MVTSEQEKQQLLDELRELRRSKYLQEKREADRQSAESALRISEERFRTLFDQSPVSMQIYSPDGVTVKVNHAFEKLWGLTQNQIAGYNILQDKELAAQGIMPLIRKAFTGEATEFPVVSYDPAVIGFPGRPRSVKGFISPVKDAAGNIVQIVLMHVDVTDLVEAEKALRTSREQLKESNARLHDMMMNMINATSKLVEMRDPYTAGHQRHVSQLALAIALEMGFSGEQAEWIRIAGLIHDFGKVFVPPEILSKPGHLSAIEFEIIRTHPTAGFDFLKIIHLPWPVAEVAHLHHERIDGSGYPLGLKGDEIPQEVRIVSVADVVEAMGFLRPYRPNIGLDKALAEIERGRGLLYDSAAADTCLKLFRENRFHFE